MAKLDTKGRVMSKAWYRAWFPESGYLRENGKPHVLKTGTGRIAGSKRTMDNAPWMFAPNHFGMDEWGPLTIYGYRMRRIIGQPWWQYPKVEKQYATAAEYADFMRSLNFYQNGYVTASGKGIGLDPDNLVGGKSGVGEDHYTCAHGRYTERSIVEQKPATFVYNNKDKEAWTGDPPPPHNPTW